MFVCSAQINIPTNDKQICMHKSCFLVTTGSAMKKIRLTLFLVKILGFFFLSAAKNNTVSGKYFFFKICFHQKRIRKKLHRNTVNKNGMREVTAYKYNRLGTEIYSTKITHDPLLFSVAQGERLSRCTVHYFC
jgi:hypothetical protein